MFTAIIRPNTVVSNWSRFILRPTAVPAILEPLCSSNATIRAWLARTTSLSCWSRANAFRPSVRPGGRARAPRPASRWSFMKTLANLSKLPPELIELIEGFCKRQPPVPAGSPASTVVEEGASTIHLGPCYGVLAVLDALARELGVAAAVGEQTRSQRLALFLIYARLAHQGSRPFGGPLERRSRRPGNPPGRLFR